MKRILGLMILAVALTGCQKAAESTRIGGPGLLTPSQAAAATGSTFNGVVVNQSISPAVFTEGARDFMEWVIDRHAVGDVSNQGGDSGMFVGGHIEFTSGQPLGAANGSISPTSQIMIAVYDKMANQPNLPPLPARVLSNANGYVSGNSVHITFTDKNGSVTLDGNLDQSSTAHLSFTYDNQVTYQGSLGHAGTLGQLYIPTCQFFHCN